MTKKCSESMCVTGALQVRYRALQVRYRCVTVALQKGPFALQVRYRRGPVRYRALQGPKL